MVAGIACWRARTRFHVNESACALLPLTADRVFLCAEATLSYTFPGPCRLNIQRGPLTSGGSRVGEQACRRLTAATL